MKIRIAALAGAVGMMAAAPAMAQLGEFQLITAEEASLYELDGTPSTRGQDGSRSPQGTTYSISNLLGAPGEGSGGGTACFFQGPGPDTVTYDGVTEATSQYGTNGNIPLVSESKTDNGAGNHDLTIIVDSITPGLDLFPAGFVSPNTGSPLTSLCIFIGIDDLLDWNGPNFVNGASLEFFASGSSIGNFDITSGFVNPWDGFLGLSFGGGAGLGIDQYVININVTKIPAPGAAVLMGVAGLVAIRRRR